MSTTNFAPKVWSARMLEAFVTETMFRDLVNTDYEGEIKGFGDTVYINTPGNITIEDNVGDITYEDVVSTQQALVIDTQKRFAFQIKDVDAVQANVSLMDKFAKKAGEGFADTVDKAIAARYVDAANIVTLDVSSDSTGVHVAMTECNQKLSENNVPHANRWMMVTPLVHAKMRQADEFLSASDMGDQIKREGHVGRYEGFDIFESNNVAIATQHMCMFSAGDVAISFAMQFVEIQALLLEKAFSEALRGLQVWGMRTVRPSALGVMKVTVA